jgi:transposase
MTTLYLGIDVSKATLDVAVAWSVQERSGLGRFENHAGGFACLATEVAALCQGKTAVTVQVVVEPTGGYECALLLFSYAQNWQVTLVNPLQVRRWAQGKGVRAKTDRQDARVLSWYGAETQPASQQPLDEGAQQLDDLLRRRTDLEKLRQAERNRLEAARHNPHTPIAVQQSLERTLQTLEAELQAMEEAIRQVLKAHPALQRQRRLLRSIPGVGEKVSLPLLVLLHRFQARTSSQGTTKQLVAFVGLDPQPHESGRSVHQRTPISRKGDARTRSLLYLGALGGKRGHNALRQCYQQLLARGKAKKLALTVCARKILVWAWAIFCSNSPFDPARFDKFAQIPP